MKQYIGCSGYYYPARIGKFYPSHIARSDRLRFYAEHFNALEVNNTFYKIPTLKALQKRYHDTPEDFCFVLKVPQIVTHEKKLEGIEEVMGEFLSVVEQGLKEKAHCLLFQLPPSFHFSTENLQRIVDIPNHQKLDYTFEFRHKSRWREDVQKALQEKGFVFCSISHPTLPDQLVTADREYIRLHGVPELYKSAYGENGLQPVIDHLQQKSSQKTYIFFNNTRFGAAIDDIKIIKDNLA